MKVYKKIRLLLTEYRAAHDGYPIISIEFYPDETGVIHLGEREKLFYSPAEAAAILGELIRGENISWNN